MSLLIVGCGYLGMRVARLARAAGREVYATTRSRETVLAASDITPLRADVTESLTLRDLPRVTTVVYCVGLDRTSGRSMAEVYIEGLANFLRAVPPPERVIYVSSTSVYGQTDGSEVTEDSVTEPSDDSGRIVLQAEKTLREHCPHAVILRFAGIYGPGRVLREKALRMGEPLVGDAEKWLNLIHVEDGASAVLTAERASPGQTFNVCDNQPVRRKDFYTLAAGLLGAPPARFVALPDGSPIPPHERANRRVQNSRLRRELGFAFRYPTYVQGLPQAIREQ